MKYYNRVLICTCDAAICRSMMVGNLQAFQTENTGVMGPPNNTSVEWIARARAQH